MLSLSSNISSLLEAEAAAKVRSTFWDDRVANLFDLGFKILFDFRFFFPSKFSICISWFRFRKSCASAFSLSLSLSHSRSIRAVNLNCCWHFSIYC